MSILSRKVGQQIRIAHNTVIVVKAIKGNRIQIAIDAPQEVHIARGELLQSRNAVLPELSMHGADSSSKFDLCLAGGL